MIRIFSSLLLLTLALRAELPPMPRPATSFGAASAGGQVYVYGGNTGKAHEFHKDCISGDFMRLAVPEGKAWETLAPGPALLGAPMVEYKGSIIRAGGMRALNAKGEKDDLRSVDTVVKFNPATSVWEPLPSFPQPRSSHDLVVFGDTLYAAGGWELGRPENPDKRGGDWYNALVKLDLAAPAKGWVTEKQPFERRALAMVVLGERIYFLGGMDSHDAPSTEVDWLEPKTGTWGKGPTLPDGPMKGFGMAAVVVGGRLIASPVTGQLYALSADGAKWEEVGALGKPRFFHRLVAVSPTSVIAVGGSGRAGHVLEPEIVTFDAAGKVLAAPKAAEPEKKDAAASWPQFRGPNRDGISLEAGWSKEWAGHPPAKLWQASIGLGMSSPVVAEGKLIAMGNDGQGKDNVVALDAATGRELWRFSYACVTASHEMPIVPNGPGATPTIADGFVYTLSREGDLHCLALADGKLAWKQQLLSDLGGKRPVYGYAQSVLADGGRLYLDLGSAEGQPGSTVALEAKTGAVAWRGAGSGEAGYSSARMIERDGQRLLAMFKGTAFELIDPQTGATLRSYRTTVRDFANASMPTPVGDRILIANTAIMPAALLDWKSGAPGEFQTVWEHKQLSLLFNSAIVIDGSLFAFNEKRRDHHEFTCVNAATGETRWVSDAVKTGTFILSDHHWIFLARDGEVVLAPANSENLRPIGRFQAVEGKCYATPTLAGGRLYVRNNAGDLAVYDLRGS